MEDEKCNEVQDEKQEVIDGYTVKYHANGKTVWSKGKMIEGKPEGYWEWYRADGRIKRSGHFINGNPVGDWVTYDSEAEKYKTTNCG